MVVLQALGDGRRAAADPGAGAVGQGAHVASPAHGHAAAHVLADVVLVSDVRQRSAPNDREQVAGV